MAIKASNCTRQGYACTCYEWYHSLDYNIIHAHNEILNYIYSPWCPLLILGPTTIPTDMQNRPMPTPNPTIHSPFPTVFAVEFKASLCMVTAIFNPSLCMLIPSRSDGIAFLGVKKYHLFIAENNKSSYIE